MKTRLIVLLIVLCCITPVSAKTLAELRADFRALANENDTAASSVPDSVVNRFLNMAQTRICAVTGYIEKTTRVSVPTVDSTLVNLPSDFHHIKHVLRWVSGAGFLEVKNNPGFQDYTDPQFAVNWKSADSAVIRFKKLIGPTSVTVIYAATPTDMTTDSTECPLPKAIEPLVVEEALGYFRTSQRDQSGQVARQNVRTDLGVGQQQ